MNGVLSSIYMHMHYIQFVDTYEGMSYIFTTEYLDTHV